MKHLTRRRAAAVSVVLTVVLPLSAFLLAPGAQADDSPGANLGGMNATAYGTGIQFIPLVKGLVPAGNLATGDFFQVSVPYSSASSQTGPSSTALSTPLYPGPVAISLSGALQTFGFPSKLATLFTDPVLAQAAFPPEPGMGSSGSYSPPAGSTTGAGTAKASAGNGGSASQSAVSNTPIANGLITVGSSTTNAATTVGANSVSDVAHADLTHISIMGGLVDIASISSQSSAVSDGTTGKQTSSLKIGAVTVAGQAAYIGPDGLHLSSTSNNLGGLNQTLNSALAALNQAGITISTVAPTSSVQGAAASVDSGVVQIHFVDQNIPSPQGDVPVTSAGSEIDLGLTHADADATALAPFTPSVGAAPVPNAAPPSSGAPPAATSSTGGLGAAVSQFNTGGTGQPVSASQPTSSGGSPAVLAPAAFLGMPTRMAWVVIAIIISIIASAPLLGYANWQLLRGRKA